VHAISVRDLSKNYGPVRAVNGLSFDVSEGEIVALLGPNGAGKTTTIEILEGHRRRSGGQVSVLGLDPEHGGRRFRERIGIMLQSGAVDAELTVVETLRLYASFYRQPQTVEQVLALTDLGHHADTRVQALSGGLERRLDLGLALIGDPQVIFLDEPTTGFDPTARRAAWDMVERLRTLGKTVLLTSHYMDEVEHLADRIVVMRNGVRVAESTPRKLGGRDLAQAVVSFAVPYPGWEGELPAGPWQSPQQEGDVVLLHTDQPTKAMSILATWAIERGEELLGLTVTRPSLEDAYLQVTRDVDSVQPR